MRTLILSLILGGCFCTYICGRDLKSFRQGAYEYYLISDSSVSISDVGNNVALPITEDSTLQIPSIIEQDGKNYSVVSIRSGAFSTRTEIKHLVINEGICYIWPYAFYSCPNLVSVQFPSTLSGIEYKNEGMFIGCDKLSNIIIDKRNKEFDSRNNCNAIIHSESNTLVLGCANSIIPSSVERIGANAFRHCKQLEFINIPEGVKHINYFAFRDCHNLKAIALPKSLESIGGSVFDNCMNLTSIFIPRNVSSVSNYVFSNCYNLTRVLVDEENPIYDSREHCNAIIYTQNDSLVAGCKGSVIPEGIKSIGNHAFWNSSISAIHIPSTVHKIGYKAFVGTRFCNTITVAPNNPIYNSANGCNAIIESSTQKLVQGCNSTIIPNSVIEIGDYAFYGLSMPTCLIIPCGVEIIGEFVFSRFCGIEYVQLPSSVRLLKKHAFNGCERLYYIDMSECSIDIEEFAFGGCKSLRIVDINLNISSVNNLAFSGTPYAERESHVQSQ